MLLGHCIYCTTWACVGSTEHIKNCKKTLLYHSCWTASGTLLMTCYAHVTMKQTLLKYSPVTRKTWNNTTAASLPLNGPRRFASDIIDNSVDWADLIADSSWYSSQERWLKRVPICCHAVWAGHCPQGYNMTMSSLVPLHSNRPAHQHEQHNVILSYVLRWCFATQTLLWRSSLMLRQLCQRAEDTTWQLSALHFSSIVKHALALAWSPVLWICKDSCKSSRGPCAKHWGALMTVVQKSLCRSPQWRQRWKV